MRSKKLPSVVSILVCVMITGCWSRQTTIVESRFPAPWGGSDRPAELKSVFYRAQLVPAMDYYEFEWIDNDGRSHGIKKIAQTTFEYMNSIGEWDEPIELPVPEDPRYVLSTMDEAQITQVPCVTIVRTIVCIDPVIIVNGPGKVQVLHRDDVAFRSSHYLNGSEQAGGLYYFLPFGLVYGRTVPYSHDPEWFSPQMHTGIQLVEMVSDDRGRIPTPWGALILTRDGDEWKVETEKK